MQNPVACAHCGRLIEEFQAKLILPFDHKKNVERRNIWLCYKCKNLFQDTIERLGNNHHFSSFEEYEEFYVKLLLGFLNFNPSSRFSFKT